MAKVGVEERRVVERYLGEVPVRLGALARELGIDVVVSTLPPGVSGQISRIGDERAPRYQIKINRHENRKRQRFTLAHELSHYLLHRDRIGDGLSDDILYRSKLSNALEFEANRLASEITMPAHAVREMVDRDDIYEEGFLQEAAERFQVSEAALTVRLGL